MDRREIIRKVDRLAKATIPILPDEARELWFGRILLWCTIPQMDRYWFDYFSKDELLVLWERLILLQWSRLKRENKLIGGTHEKENRNDNN